MTTFKNILFESEYKRFLGKVRVTYSESSSIMDVAEILRAIEDVTIVNPIGGDKEKNRSIYDVKFFSYRPPTEAFSILRQKALRFPDVIKLEIATQTIEYF